MSTLVLTIAYFDDAHVYEWEFNSLDAIKVYLDAGDVDSISMIKLNDTNTGITCEGIDAIYQYIRENTGPVLLTHDLSQCGDACNCMKCNPSKSSCIAFSGSPIPVKPDTTEYVSLPRVERFGDLPDGTLFYLAQTYAYGGRQKLQKTLEDGGEHNAVYVNMAVSGQYTVIPDDQTVIRA